MSSLLTGLKLYYNFQGNGNDVSGNGNNATTTNVSFSLANGKILQGGGFINSPNSAMTATTSLATGNQPLSVSFWIRRTGGASFPYLFAVGDTNLSNQFLGMYETGGNVFFYTAAANVSVGNIGGGAWTSIIISYNGTNAQVYFNGVLASTITVAISFANSNVAVGSVFGLPSYNAFLGNIDEFGVWQRALTPAEVTQLYNAGTGLTYPFSPLLTGLVSYYPLEGNANDSLGINNGTPTNITFSIANGKILQGGGFLGTTSSTILTPKNGFPVGAGTRTYVSWIKTSSSSLQVFYLYGDTTTASTAFAFLINTSGQLGIGTGGGVDFFTSTVVNDGNWHFIVSTYDGTTLKIFIDNVNQLSSPATLNTSGGSTTFQFSWTLGAPFSGSMDEVGLWNRVLTTPEITQLWNDGAGLTYPFLAPSASTNASFLFNIL